MSEPSPTLNSCPQCGATLPSAATKGLCPKCLLAEAMVPTQDAAEPAPSRTNLTPAELAPHFPQLEILECLGRGGMGVVYKARQKLLNRFVALKLLVPERVADAKFAQRFAQEAQALATLNHPSIVTIHDFGLAGGFYFLLMEFVDGVNLRQAMKAGRFTPEQALAVVPPVCEALQYAHEHGIVHRDIKPENLLLDKDGRVKIADFGIAKMLNADGARLGSETQPQHVGDPSPTAAGPADTAALQHSAAGTPHYMAPEQKEHRRTDHRADIYSLGVVLYELLTGELPADELQPPSRKVQIDVRLDEIVLRALETKPELRYQTAGEFRTQVETIADGATAISTVAQSEYVSSWGFRLTPGPAIKTGYVRFWESLFGSVESSGAITALNLSRIGFIGILAVLAIVPGWRSFWPAFAFLGMFAGIGVAYVSEAAARRGVDLSKTDGTEDAKSRRAVWRRRVVRLIVGGGVLPMAFFALSLIVSLGRGGEKAVEAATFGQMLTVFAKVLGIGFGLALMIWALLRVFWRRTAHAANPWPRQPEALVALSLLWPLLLMTAPFVILQFVGSSEERLYWEALRADPRRSALLNSAEWITWGLGLVLVVRGAIWITRNIRRDMRAMDGPPDRQRGPELERSLPVRQGWHKALVTLLLAIAIVIPLHVWVLQAFVIPVTSLEPELPAGSRVLVWKLTRKFAPGDIIAHTHGAQVWVSRVVREEKEQLVLQRNQRPEEKLPHADVIGKVVSVLWRPTPRMGAPAVPSTAARAHPLQSVDNASSGSMEPEHLKDLSWHEFDQTPGKFWRELAGDRRFPEAAKLIELYLSLHPGLEEGVQRLNGGNLHFHAAQCWAFAGDHERAQKHLSESKHDAADGDFLWNDYVAGTAAFLRGDQPALLAAREKLQAKGAAINQPNLAVLDRLIAHFGQPYLDAYDSGQHKSTDQINQPAAPITRPTRAGDASSTVTDVVPSELAVGVPWVAILLAVLALFGVAAGGVVLLVVLFRKRSSTAARVLAVLGIVALHLFLVGVGLLIVWGNTRRNVTNQAARAEQVAMTERQKLEHQAATAGFPTGAHIGRDGHSVLFRHDSVDLHYVFYYTGDFGSSSSGSRHAKTRSWVDEGSVNLKNGRTFGYRREALSPDELTVNGARHDLRKGRVFVLNDDGTITQRSLSVPLSIARDPVSLGQFITEHGDLPESAGTAVRSPGYFTLIMKVRQSACGKQSPLTPALSPARFTSSRSTGWGEGSTVRGILSMKYSGQAIATDSR